MLCSLFFKQSRVFPLPSHHAASVGELSERPSILGSAGCPVGCRSAVRPGAAGVGGGSASLGAGGDIGRGKSFLTASWWQRDSLSPLFLHRAKASFNLQPPGESSGLKSFALLWSSIKKKKKALQDLTALLPSAFPTPRTQESNAVAKISFCLGHVNLDSAPLPHNDGN